MVTPPWFAYRHKKSRDRPSSLSPVVVVLVVGRVRQEGVGDGGRDGAVLRRGVLRLVVRHLDLLHLLVNQRHLFRSFPGNVQRNLPGNVE